MKTVNQEGAIPVVIIIAIAIATIGGSLIGIGVYMATHAFSAIMVASGLSVIFALFVLPNLSSIVKWWKGVKHEVTQSIEEINNEDHTNHNADNPRPSQDVTEANS
jgi:hypothetical protein